MSDEPTGRQLPLFPGPGAPRQSPERIAPMPAIGRDATLAVAAGAFDEHLAREGKTENTRRAFASDLRLVGRFLGPDHPVRAISTDALNRFLSWMLEYRGRPCSAKTYGRRVTTLKVFFGWLVASGVRDDDPAAALVHRRAEAPLPLVLTDAQTDALLAEARSRRVADPGDPRPELLVRLVLDTGLKKGEVTRLRVADLVTETAPPSLLVRYDSPRWRNKERRIGFDAAILPVLALYQARYAPAERLFECTARNLEYVLTDLVGASGLPDKTGFETLRWTSALAKHRAGMPPDVLRARLGLSPISWAETERRLDLLAGGA